MQSEVLTAFRSCPECRHRNPKGSTACAACGAALKRRICLACGAANDVLATNCRSCGEEIAASEPSSVFAPLESQWGAEPSTQQGIDAVARAEGRPGTGRPSPAPARLLRTTAWSAIAVVVAVAGFAFYRSGTPAPEGLEAAPAGDPEPQLAAPATTPADAPPIATPSVGSPAATPVASGGASPRASATAVLGSPGLLGAMPSPARATAAPAPSRQVSAPRDGAATAADGGNPAPPAPAALRTCTPSLAALALCTMNN